MYDVEKKEVKMSNSFRFRDWSKEAMMDLAESLVPEVIKVPDNTQST